MKQELHAQRDYLLAAWFEETYMHEKWRTWYYCASGAVSVSPNQNPIESYHSSIKVSGYFYFAYAS